jgi:uncharacterized Fe-S cluster protein YjdI
MITEFDIRGAIISGNYTANELDGIAQALKFARARLAQRQIRACVKGDQVRFTNPKTGAIFCGTVDRVKIKNVIVSTPQGRYNVPANLLEFA